MGECDAGTLEALRRPQGAAIHTRLHPDQRVPIRVVVAGRNVFVRSADSARGRWYRDLMARPQATLSSEGREPPVQAAAGHEAETVAAVSRRHLRNYGIGPYARAMVKPNVRAFTLRHEPREGPAGSCDPRAVSARAASEWPA